MRALMVPFPFPIWSSTPLLTDQGKVLFVLSTKLMASVSHNNLSDYSTYSFIIPYPNTILHVYFGIKNIRSGFRICTYFINFKI